MIRAAIIPWRKSSRAKFPTLIIQPVRQSHESGGALPHHGPEIWETAKAKSPISFAAWVPRNHQRRREISEGEKSIRQGIGVDPYGSLYYDFVKRRNSESETYVVEGIGGTSSLHDESEICDDVIQVNDEEAS